MGKSAIRILPPLVNGKLSGNLEFEIDYLEITEKIFKNENHKFLVRIIWWGETKPLLLRPKKSKFITYDNKEIIVDEQDECTVKYEVRTKIKLFKSYLMKCEEVELTILDSVNNEVIGSTFLKDLTYLVYNVDCFISSIVTDTGDVAGKITCHFRFLEGNSIEKKEKACKTGIPLTPVEKWNDNDLKISLDLSELYLPRDDLLCQCASDRTNREIRSGRTNNVHYNSPVTRMYGLTCDAPHAEQSPDWKIKALEDSDLSKLKVSPKKMEPCKDMEIKLGGNSNNNVTSNIAKESKKTVRPIKAKIPSRKKEEDTIRTINAGLENSSKVINKKPRVKMKECTRSTSQKNQSTTTGKMLKGVRRGNGDPKAMKVNNSAMVPKLSKTPNTVSAPTAKPSIKTFEKVSSEISKLSKLHLNSDPHCNYYDAERGPVKENKKDLVEDNAMRGMETKEKLQSPTSVISPGKSSESAKDIKSHENGKTDDKNSKKINVNNKLFFYLDDPVEKLYYETFFIKTEIHSSNEFEIAELLNQPGNNYILDSKPRDGIELGGKLLVENELQTEADINVRGKSLPPVDVRQKDRSLQGEEADSGDSTTEVKDFTLLRNENEFEDFSCESEKSMETKTNCQHCKHFKKLSELDSIIVALKSFESKLRTEVKRDWKMRDDYHHECAASILAEIVQENENTENSDQWANVNESDYSKEDSDFVEFRRYLSTR